VLLLVDDRFHEIPDRDHSDQVAFFDDGRCRMRFSVISIGIR
jgi:hypothetical protein